ncbi:MAG: hypothetical protein ABIP27_06120 [Flavobacterium circumlabens]|uniref:hypothetical protein n=1 Tax=Flavobacterium circumlabens TaxID=2133765 RepID=UPI003266A460
MKKILIVLVLLCFLISCYREEPNFTKEMIVKLADDEDRENDLVTINRYSFLDLYIRTTENEVLVTNSNYLYESYKLDYSKKYKSFKIFLETVLNKDFAFDKSDQKIMLARYFKLNSKMEKKYTNLGFDKFFKKYTKPSNRKDQIELNKSLLKSDEYYTIKYLLYLNKYDISFDDIRVKYSIIKREDSFK